MSYPLWIVVANGSRARVLQRMRPGEPLTEVKDWVSPSTRQQLHNFEGKHRHSGIRGRAGLAEPTEPKDHERDVFALDICRWLTHALHTQQVARIALIAPNRFLGELVHHAQGQLEKHVCAKHALDLTDLPLPPLAQRLHEDFGL